MKKSLWLMMLSCITVLTSCNNELNEEIAESAPDSLCTFSINLIPTFSIEPMTRAVTSDLASVCTDIDIRVINQGSKALVASVHQVNTDEGFGSVTIGLPTGTYNFYAFAHNGGTIERYGDTHFGITYENYFGGDAFSFHRNSVHLTQDMSFNWELKRIVSKFSLTLTDSRIPADVTKIRIKMNNVSTTYACTFGTNTYVSTDLVYKDFDITTYDERLFEVLMFPKTTNTSQGISWGSCNVVIEALKADGSVLESRSFDDATFGIGYVSKLRGALFSPTYNPFTLTLDPAWEEMNSTSF